MKRRPNEKSQLAMLMLNRYPRTVRVSEQTWQVEKKILVESVQTKNIYSKPNS